ncbi:uncharacterized protein N7498_008853 [Penicillium cinerascens]|uniref:Uncharacterized protein n=1 Tax=Penicillium cinerascens TaxID=70096 RepID=A0A9W9MAL6_9EURO|nr:uncharacterized protein N7498_008853 [Penicillium cinerascens]KAJ5195415.1 hypothetical protein N7498_008853 [Penicillium cinerascens]
MAGKSKAPPQPACVEDFDEDSHDAVPDSRQVANTAAKLHSRLDLRSPAEPLIDGASDSGYSSRTAATANSTQSGPSGGKSPPVLHKLDMPKRDRVDIAKGPSSRKERRDKERARPTRDEKMQMGAYAGSAHHHAPVPRSPSKSRRRDSVRYNADYGYGYDAKAYHYSSTPVETRAMEFPPYFARPPVPDYPPSSPQSARFPPAAYEEYHASRPSGRPGRSNSYRGMYHQERPVSFHGGMHPSMGPPHMYQAPPVYPYDHGPPPAQSAYVSQPYSSSPYGGSYYAGSDFPAPAEYVPERSQSRPREASRPRRSSVYAYPLPDDMFPWDDGDYVEQQHASREPQPREALPRESRGRRSSKPVVTQARDEDYYKMPPPPPPAPKQRAAPQIHQPKRPQPHKAQTTQAIPSQRRSSRATDRSIDLSDMAAALPEVAHRRLSREARLPERSHSLRDSKRSMSYHDNARGAQIAVENSNSRRRRPQQYYYEDAGSIGDLEDREREIERYQALKAGRPASAMPLSTEALIPKLGNGTGSDHGSQKSRSNSSRGSGSKYDGESKNINLEVNGMTIGFTEQGIAGKSINIRTGDSGGVHLNIAGGRKPQQYLTGGSLYSSHTGGSGQREIEDVRRPRERDELRSERSSRESRRTSQSTYGRNRRYQAV